MVTYYERKILPQIRGWIDKKAIVVLTGMRQVGKTTLFRMLYEEIKSKNKAFLDIENPIIQRIFQESDYENIWHNLKAYGIIKEEKSYLFLDEIQAMPQIVKMIKYLFDKYDVQFFLTGSSSFYLKNLFPESLAGRKAAFELFPLDFEEFLIFKNSKRGFYEKLLEKEKHKNYISYERCIKLYEEYLKYGGFPRVVLAKTDEEKRTFLEDIYKSYFEKDVRVLSDFKDIKRLQEFILLMMQRAGSKMNISRISSEMGISRESAYSYLSFLQATYFISLISPFSRNVDREVSGAKKVYICDTGFLNHFAQVSSGAVLENAVFNILKKFDYINYYQRRGAGGEIDFILKEHKIGIEVKEKGTVYDVQRSRHIARALRLKKTFVVSKVFSEEEGIIPVTEL